MKEKEIIQALKRGGKKEIKCSASGEAVKCALISMYVKKGGASVRPKGFRFYFKFAAAAAFFIAVTAAMVFTMFDDMDDGDRFNRSGGIWSTYTDLHQGGDSVVWPPETNERVLFSMSKPGYGGTGWAVRVTGKAGTNLGQGYNYFGLVARLKEESACPQCSGTDISRYKGMVFRVKGDLKGGVLQIILPYESSECIAERKTCKSLTGYADYYADISDKVGPEWSAVMLDFRQDLRQPGWTPGSKRVDVETLLKSVHLFKWQFSGGTGEAMELWIDDIQLY